MSAEGRKAGQQERRERGGREGGYFLSTYCVPGFELTTYVNQYCYIMLLLPSNL